MYAKHWDIHQRPEPKTIQINDFKYFYPERPRLLHVNQPLFESLSQNSAWVAEPK